MASRSLTPAHCPTCDAALRIPNGAVHVDCVRCGTSFLLQEASLIERTWNGAQWVLGAGLLCAGAAIFAVGWMFRPMPPHPVDAVASPQEIGLVTAPSVQAPPPQAPPVQAPPKQAPPPAAPGGVFNSEPDYLRDRAAMAALSERLHQATNWTGRLAFLSIGPNRSVVAQVEVEDGFDSVVFSWGTVTVKPVAVADEDRLELEHALFTLSQETLVSVPAAVEAALDGAPSGASVDNVLMRRGAGGVQMRISRIHPRRVLDDVVVPLDTAN